MSTKLVLALGGVLEPLGGVLEPLEPLDTVAVAVALAAERAAEAAASNALFLFDIFAPNRG
jgi:hypothetical protein